MRGHLEKEEPGGEYGKKMIKELGYEQGTGGVTEREGVKSFKKEAMLP